MSEGGSFRTEQFQAVIEVDLLDTYPSCSEEVPADDSTSERQPAHFVFPTERYGAAGEKNSFGFTAGVVIYDTDPTRPIGDWKEAWEKAKERAGAILSGKTEEEEPEPLKCRFHDLRHTAITRLLEAGIPYPVVASMMGWSAATAIRMAKRWKPSPP